jgi:hypothetical protein
MKNNLYVHYGCGKKAPIQWLNFDASPSLRLQRLPLLGFLLKPYFQHQFPAHVYYGNIVKGLPLAPGSCKGIYASHILEHLSLADAQTALKNTFELLAPNGIFRCVVPDLEQSARKYVTALENKDEKANYQFLGHDTELGLRQQPNSLIERLSSNFGHTAHLWMWDQYALAKALREAGFREVRRCKFGDCIDPLFSEVEEEKRFEYSIAFEAKK